MICTWAELLCHILWRSFYIPHFVIYILQVYIFYKFNVFINVPTRIMRSLFGFVGGGAGEEVGGKEIWQMGVKCKWDGLLKRDPLIDIVKIGSIWTNVRKTENIFKVGGIRRETQQPRRVATGRWYWQSRLITLISYDVMVLIFLQIIDNHAWWCLITLKVLFLIKGCSITWVCKTVAWTEYYNKYSLVLFIWWKDVQKQNTWHPLKSQVTGVHHT